MLQNTENPSKIHLYEIMKYEMMKCDAQRVKSCIVKIVYSENCGSP